MLVGASAADGHGPAPTAPTDATPSSTAEGLSSGNSPKRKRDDSDEPEAPALAAATATATSSVATEATAVTPAPMAAAAAPVVPTPTPAPTPAGNDKEDEEAPAVDDRVRLWEAGWKERYYTAKFRVDARDQDFVRGLVRAYAEGVAWVMLYYYQGCASWKWFFPEHYSPFASDFKLLGDFRPRFERGQPFRPLEQLMAVFPPASRELIPPPLRPLMTDPESSIIDFYPTSFEIDLKGKAVRLRRRCWPRFRRSAAPCRCFLT